MMARIHTARERGQDRAEASEGKDVQTPFQRRRHCSTGRKRPAYNALRAKAALRRPEGDCFGAVSTSQTGAKLKLRHYPPI